MTNWQTKIREYYTQGLWSREQVLSVVGKVLTQEEAEEILSSK